MYVQILTEGWYVEVEVLSRGNGIHWDEAIRVLSIHGGQQNLPFHKPTAVLKILFISDFLGLEKISSLAELVILLLEDIGPFLRWE